MVPNVGRMRNTWLLHHMATGTPLGPLAAAAGLQTFRTIEKLFPYLADTDPRRGARSDAPSPAECVRPHVKEVSHERDPEG